ncbi:hypothetical protein C2L64_46965 [Paraburkholderia hospita]|uniref:Uncharacterized protein n=1 Tax=Paraburkholderia hospita TaxID=169430 RepID=A0AAN1JLA2_9BURK|nr:hypothetical protein C2L64_46965 [Paraburkholderia hospita]
MEIASDDLLSSQMFAQALVRPAAAGDGTLEFGDFCAHPVEVRFRGAAQRVCDGPRRPAWSSLLASFLPFHAPDA